LQCEGATELLFTENESNASRLWGQPNASPYVKDAFHEYLIAGKKEAVNPAKSGNQGVLYILCAATGMRIAEAPALDMKEHINPGCSVIRVRRRVKKNKLVTHLKTDAAYRYIDLALCVSKLLRKYIGDRRGLLFPSKTGCTRMTYSNVRRRSIHPKLVALGFYTPGAAMHCLRRFRASVLKKNRCPEHLEKFGWARKS
jgi:integrase